MTARCRRNLPPSPASFRLAQRLGADFAYPQPGEELLHGELALGDADVWLDIIPDYTIQDVAENITRLDYSLLKRSLTKHDCGAFLLPRPVKLGEATSITPDELRRVIALLKATFPHLIIDVSKNFGPLDLAAMDAVWAHTEHVKCVHPGWPLITGWDAVRESWRVIFENTAEIRFTIGDVAVVVNGSVAWVTCTENILQSVRDRLSVTGRAPLDQAGQIDQYLVRCRYEGTDFELTMSADAYAGMASWLESGSLGKLAGGCWSTRFEAVCLWSTVDVCDWGFCALTTPKRVRRMTNMPASSGLTLFGITDISLQMISMRDLFPLLHGKLTTEPAVTQSVRRCRKLLIAVAG